MIQNGSYCRGGNGVNTATAEVNPYNRNAAYYTGSVGINICQKGIPSNQGDNPSTQQYYTYSCGTAYGGYNGVRITSGYDMENNCWTPYDQRYVYVRNNSGSQHTVYGRARYGAGQGFPCC